jgi:ribosomal-protein-alanine N-acetyltransferase
LALAPQPAGFVLCLPAGEAYDIVAIGVVAEQRRRGLGRRLLAHCALRARQAGALRLMLEVAADDAAALAFYRGTGFAETARRANYYPPRACGAARDALVLAKSL